MDPCMPERKPVTMRSTKQPGFRLGSMLMIFWAVCSTTLAHAQFTYVGADLGYFGGFPLKDATFIQGNIGFTVQHRPMRNLGFGISITAPVVTSSKVNMPLGKSSAIRSNAYEPTTQKHEITRSASITAFSRFYTGKDLIFFMDVRFSMLRMTERVLASRPYAPVEYYSDGSIMYPAIPELSLDYSAEYSIYAPGIGIGIMPHISEKLFFLTAVYFDAYLFGEPGYSYTVPYSVDLTWNTHETKKFESPLSGTNLSVMVAAGLGMHF